MPLLHPEKKINLENLPKAYHLREIVDPKEIAESEKVLKLMEHAVKGEGSFTGANVIHSAAQICRYGSDLVYHTVGMRLYQHLMETGEIEVPWWDAFVSVIGCHVMWGIRLRGDVKPEHQEKLYGLLEMAEKATMTEEAEEILRSIAPKEVAVLSET